VDWEKIVAEQQAVIDRQTAEAKATPGVTNVKPAPPRDEWKLAKSQSQLGVILRSQKKPEEAERLFRLAQVAFERSAEWQNNEREDIAEYQSARVDNLQRLMSSAYDAKRWAEYDELGKKLAATYQRKFEGDTFQLSKIIGKDWQLPETTGSFSKGGADLTEFMFESAVSYERAWMFFAKKVGHNGTYNAADSEHVTDPKYVITDERSGNEPKFTTRFAMQKEKYAIVLTLTRKDKNDIPKNEALVRVRGVIIAR
jgi:hypothetical protein